MAQNKTLLEVNLVELWGSNSIFLTGGELGVCNLQASSGGIFNLDFSENIVLLFSFVPDGRTDPILDDVGDAFKLMGVNLHELEDYIHNIEPVTFAHQIPSFPVSKNNVLQFPQLGSKDAEERKEYIPDYLPPIVSSQEGAKSILCFQFCCVWVFVGIPQQLKLCCPVKVAWEGQKRTPMRC